jgi:hypothetical protein
MSPEPSGRDNLYVGIESRSFGITFPNKETIQETFQDPDEISKDVASFGTDRQLT